MVCLSVPCSLRNGKVGIASRRGSAFLSSSCRGARANASTVYSPSYQLIMLRKELLKLYMALLRRLCWGTATAYTAALGAAMRC